VSTLRAAAIVLGLLTLTAIVAALIFYIVIIAQFAVTLLAIFAQGATLT
jgi:hypothetical protein